MGPREPSKSVDSMTHDSLKQQAEKPAKWELKVGDTVCVSRSGGLFRSYDGLQPCTLVAKEGHKWKVKWETKGKWGGTTSWVDENKIEYAGIILRNNKNKRISGYFQTKNVKDGPPSFWNGTPEYWKTRVVQGGYKWWYDKKDGSSFMYFDSCKMRWYVCDKDGSGKGNNGAVNYHYKSQTFPYPTYDDNFQWTQGEGSDSGLPDTNQTDSGLPDTNQTSDALGEPRTDGTNPVPLSMRGTIFDRVIPVVPPESPYGGPKMKLTRDANCAKPAPRIMTVHEAVRADYDGVYG